MIPNPIRLTRIVRKMMSRGRVTTIGKHSTITGMKRYAALAVLMMIVPAAAQQRLQQPAPLAAPRADTLRPEILGTRGIVAAGRHYSVSAGVRIMQQGGNAIDAGVATVFAAAVCEISHFGFGGESPVMIYDAKTREIIVINGQGSAPKGATPEVFKSQG